MTKKNTKPSTNLVSGGVLKEIQSCRPLRLFIEKQKKKGKDDKPFALRSKFLQLSIEKKIKYYQKSIDKYIQLLDEKNINEQVQIEGQLFENLLSKTEQRIYFQSLNAPTKPLHSAAAYYSDSKKNEKNSNAKPWKVLSADEKKPYIKMWNDAKLEYAIQIKNFTNDLPDRLKCEYLSFINPVSHTNVGVDDDDENAQPVPISQRRKSVQSIPESFKTNTNDNQQKLHRVQLDELHKCQPSIIYYEKKVPDDEKPTFENSTKKNVYIRSLFNQISEKKRHKFILKSIKKWEEFLELNPTIIEYQIPTLHLLLGRQDDIHYYFSSLGLPVRPPISANILFNNEKQQQQQNWIDLSQTIKDEYIKRLSKMKNEYQKNFLEFVDNILPSDYIRLEFFRNVKYAAKDYELFTKNRINEIDDGQLKITEFLTPTKKSGGDNDINEFDRIKQELLATSLNKEQKKLVKRLGELMNKYIEETTASKKESSNSAGTTKSITTNSNSLKRRLTDSSDVVLVNGDNIERFEDENNHKKKKKHKQIKTENEEKPSVATSSTTKKRK